MNYYCLGKSGVRVCQLCLGTMTFGTELGWGNNKKDAEKIFNAYVDLGGNFVDTADMYTKGTSEKMVGEFIAKRKLRDHIVLTTKFSWNTDPGNPNGGGNGRKYMMRAVEDSLRRLGTDYIDLYLLHVWDCLTPVEDVMRTFNDLVSSGKVRHVGFSDVPAWVASRAQTMAEIRAMEPISVMQMEYSLVERNIEHEYTLLGKELGIDIMSWSPLGGGLLTGKYQINGKNVKGDGRFKKIAAENDIHFLRLTKRNEQIILTLREVAKELGKPMSQVALNWVANRPAVGSLVFGATSVSQLENNMQSLDFTIPGNLVEKLDEVSRPTLNFPYNFFSPDMQKRVHGGEAALDKPFNHHPPRKLRGDEKPFNQKSGKKK